MTPSELFNECMNEEQRCMRDEYQTADHAKKADFHRMRLDWTNKAIEIAEKAR